MKILVTPRSLTRTNHPALDLLRQQGWELIFSAAGQMPDERNLLELVHGCDGWLAGVEPITATVLAGANRLRVISRNGSGLDNIDLPEAERRGIKVMRAAGANAQGVAELTLGLTLASLRQIHAADRALKSGAWDRTVGQEIAGCFVLVVGFGNIGRLVARLFEAFGAEVAVVEPLSIPTDDFRKVDLDEHLPSARIVTLHCPPQADDRPLLTKARIELCSKNALVINTARRSLVDELAVIEALEQDQLGGFACDEFEGADPASQRLIRHPRVIATPHLGAFTSQSVDRAAFEAARNLIRELAFH
ncbi:MAG: oxidoreductase [Verrucomicrobia bacterium]|nr:oxidoreductase [Verrucomicrobiota bacterium]